jgi:hypothetical protein
MAAAPPQAEAAVLYREFDQSFTASHAGNGRPYIGISVDVVNGLGGSGFNGGSHLSFYPDRLTFAPGENGGTHGDPKGFSSDPSPSIHTSASITGGLLTAIASDTVTLHSLVDGSGSYQAKGSFVPSPGSHYLGFVHSIPRPEDEYAPSGYENPDAHYGWIRYDYEPGLDGHIRLLEGAVESTPGLGIRVGGQAPVPEPGVMALLALGAAGFVRRRRTQVA